MRALFDRKSPPPIFLEERNGKQKCARSDQKGAGDDESGVVRPRPVVQKPRQGRAEKKADSLDEQIGAEIIGQSLGAEEIAEQNGVEAEIDGDEEAESGDAARHRRIIGAERKQRDAKSAKNAGRGE